MAAFGIWLKSSLGGKVRNLPYFIIGMLAASLTGVLTVVAYVQFLGGAPEETPEKTSTSIQLPGSQTGLGPQQAPTSQQSVLEPETRQVDSVAQSLQYPVSEWNAVSFYSGFIDQILVDGEDRTSQQVIDVPRNSLITLTGWAGHPEFGMRTPTVVFTVCDTVIGVATVQDPRQDVAANVHINLARSGWRAVIAAEHLPHCEKMFLIAWAQAPLGYNIFPLHGGRILNFSESNPPSFKLISRYRPVRHSERSQPPLRTISVNADVLRIRRCPTTNCEVVGKFTSGQYNGFLIEDAGDWSLVQIDQEVGWVSNRYILMQ